MGKPTFDLCYSDDDCNGHNRFGLRRNPVFGLAEIT